MSSEENYRPYIQSAVHPIRSSIYLKTLPFHSTYIPSQEKINEKQNADLQASPSTEI